MPLYMPGFEIKVEILKYKYLYRVVGVCEAPFWEDSLLKLNSELMVRDVIL